MGGGLLINQPEEGREVISTFCLWMETNHQAVTLSQVEKKTKTFDHLILNLLHFRDMNVILPTKRGLKSTKKAKENKKLLKMCNNLVSLRRH